MYYIDMRNKKVYELYNDPEAEYVKEDFRNDCDAGLLYGEDPEDCMISSLVQYWYDYLYTVIMHDMISLEMESKLRWLRCAICKYFKQNNIEVKNVKYVNYTVYVDFK